MFSFTIQEKPKKETFSAIFQLIKCSTQTANITMRENGLFIQGMDQCHICLFELFLHSSWFSEYQFNNETNINVAVSTSVLCTILATKSDEQRLTISYENNDDKLSIEYVNITTHVDANSKNLNHNKYFSIPLIEYDYDVMGIPETEYDAEFKVSAKTIVEIINQLSVFGNELTIQCSETAGNIFLIAQNDGSTMKVEIQPNDIESFSIVEDGQLNLTYSLINISKMCLSKQISQFITFNLNPNAPMKILYDLTPVENEDATSYLYSFIAPKIKDD